MNLYGLLLHIIKDMIMYNRILLLLIALFIQLSNISGQEGYNIPIRITGNEKSFISIAYHLGDKQYIKDTLQTDDTGLALFSGNTALEQGLYMVVMPDNSYFEVIIAEDQTFEIECSKGDFQGTLNFKGSDENSAFLDYQKGWRSKQDASIQLRKRREASSQNSDSLEILGNLQKELESEMIGYLRQVAAENEGTILSALLMSMIPVEMPEFEIPYDSPNPDSIRWIMTYNYNASHYLDNIDLTDPRLIRTPVLYNKINTFFTSIIIQHPDTIIREMNRIIKLAEPDPQVFRFMVVYLFNHFRESQVMGHDAILVELADNYYLTGKVDWVSDEFKSDLRNDVEKIRNNLIGRRGMDLTMETYDGTWRSVYDLNNDFIILYFWEPGCGHCKTTTPKLKEIYSRMKPEGIEVFAVCTQDNREEWEKYIAENELEWINGWDPARQTHFDYYYNVNSTPMIYILNRDKTIIAKKLPVESIENFIANYKKYGL